MNGFKISDLRVKSIVEVFVFLLVLSLFSCSKNTTTVLSDSGTGYVFIDDFLATVSLPQREGQRPETTTGIPHVQIGVNFIPEVNQELYRRVYSVPGIEQLPSVIGGWQGLSINSDVNIVVNDAIIGEREFGHIHDDGSLHIYLPPSRAEEAVSTCWAIYHPFAIGQTGAISGFVMLYTPQSIEELNVTFQLIVDAYNFITKQNIIATDYY